MNSDQINTLEFCEQACLSHAEEIADIENALDSLRCDLDDALETLETLEETIEARLAGAMEGTEDG